MDRSRSKGARIESYDTADIALLTTKVKLSITSPHYSRKLLLLPTAKENVSEYFSSLFLQIIATYIIRITQLTAIIITGSTI